MDRKAIKSEIQVPGLKNAVVLYRYGSGNKRVLMVHGWSGRATQMVRIADALIDGEYEVISFDAPAHHKSRGSSTIMMEFIAAIGEVDRMFGPFEAVIGHSLGGMSALNAATRNLLHTNSIVIIGSGDIIADIISDFISKLRLPQFYNKLLKDYFERKYHQTMDDYSSYIAAQKIDVPVLVIHDHDDPEVPVKCAIHIHKHLPKGQLILTKGLGHRKILGDQDVIHAIKNFISKT